MHRSVSFLVRRLRCAAHDAATSALGRRRRDLGSGSVAAMVVLWSLAVVFLGLFTLMSIDDRAVVTAVGSSANLQSADVAVPAAPFTPDVIPSAEQPVALNPDGPVPPVLPSRGLPVALLKARLQVATSTPTVTVTPVNNATSTPTVTVTPVNNATSTPTVTVTPVNNATVTPTSVPVTVTPTATVTPTSGPGTPTVTPTAGPGTPTVTATTTSTPGTGGAPVLGEPLSCGVTTSANGRTVTVVVPVSVAGFFAPGANVVLQINPVVYDGPLPVNRTMVFTIPASLPGPNHVVTLTTTLLSGAPYSVSCSVFTDPGTVGSGAATGPTSPTSPTSPTGPTSATGATGSTVVVPGPASPESGLALTGRMITTIVMIGLAVVGTGAASASMSRQLTARSSRKETEPW